MRRNPVRDEGQHVRVRMMIDIQEGVSWEQWQALALAAEAADVDLFSSDHYASFHSGRTGGLDAWATLAGVASMTKRIRLGTLMSPVGFRHPSVLARIVTTVDHISAGRVELGLGTGWLEDEYHMNGLPFPSQRERFEHLAEQIEIVIRTWTEDRWDHDGPRYRLRDQTGAPRNVQRPHPPLIMGASARPRSLALAGRYAQEYNIVFCAPERCSEVRAKLDGACDAAGRDPAALRLSLMTPAALGEDEADARARLQRIMRATGRDPDGDVPRHWIVGTVEQAAATLAAYARNGVECVYLQNHDRANDETVALLGRLAKMVS
ncbi:MAG TPA: LLM class flavin-dependent oxidoreductase [Baekduia sp.]|nr:LLM class flavin-dependent oxidoreductase [Baekduia sp.]